MEHKPEEAIPVPTPVEKTPIVEEPVSPQIEEEKVPPKNNISRSKTLAPEILKPQPKEIKRDNYTYIPSPDSVLQNL